MKRIVIAAPSSGSGKTTVTLGIMAALKRRGLTVAPFKVGPDFIDPGYHRLATGAVSVNLDGWICSPDFVLATFALHAAGADIAVVEGVMGLFDGIDGASEAGSSAEMAKLLDARVVLVADARSRARSAAALVHGFASFDSALQLAGVIFNNVASANHEKVLRDAMAAALPEIPVIGCLPKDPELAIPSRHLGLLTAEENPLPEEFLSHLVQVIERHLDLERLLALSFRGVPGKRWSRISDRKRHGFGPRRSRPLPFKMRDKVGMGSPPLEPAVCRSRPLPFKGRDRVGMGAPSLAPSVCPVDAAIRIAVARDAAFCFVYEDNLRLLREQGAELCFFSPLTDAVLPERISGIYLPGGYPELFAERLAANQPLKEALRRAVEEETPVYAECGGFIYLTQGVQVEGALHPFVGIFPVQTRMLPRPKALGYREVELLSDAIIGDKGRRARGHEFHYSEMEEMPDTVQRIYSVSKKGRPLGEEGFRYKKCLASYIHLHFGSSPAIAEAFVGHCRSFQGGSLT